METFALNRSGFVTDWLVSGPARHPFEMKNDCVDQLAYEAKLRQNVRNEDYPAPPSVRLGERFLENNPWRYHFTNANWFVQFMCYGHNTDRVDAAAATVLIAPEDMTLQATLWTYASVDLWVNGEKLAVVPFGVYKPIIRMRVSLPLKKGENLVYVRLQALAVRDTMNLFGLQLPTDRGVSVTLPDGENTAPIIAAAKWLRAVGFQDGSLVFDAPPCAACIGQDDLAGKTAYPVGGAETLTVRVSVAGQTFARKLEFAHNIHAAFVDEPSDVSEARRNMYRFIGKQEKVPRGIDNYFAGYNILARYATGDQTGLDYDLFYNDLDVMQKRRDCSEFIAAALLRLVREYDMGTAALAEMKRVFLDYRYWMDEAGEDGMCFWSENHALMFFGVQLLAGEMWQDDIFTRSGRTGREQYAVARKRCNDWLDDVLAHGFEEFLSANYMNVTMGTLVNLIDYGPEEISEKATKVLDEQFRQIGIQTFDGSIIAPMGRVYRAAIYPFRQDSQGMLHYLDGKNPFCATSDSWWLSSLATCKYVIPDETIRELTHARLQTTYFSGNACVYVNKTPDYMLTGVQCPSGEARRWRNVYQDAHVDVGSNEYVKSLNEKFHGTSCLTPGQYGYQQHFGYMALTREAVTFTNHPGTAGEDGGMRPGYWYANGVMPAQKLAGNTVGQIYCIDDTHPLDFTHLYFPSDKFSAWEFDGNWLLAKAGNGYIGVWCSAPLTAHDDMLFACEWRAYGRKTAFLGKIESASACDFDAFKQACRASAPVFDENALTLCTADGFAMAFSFERDDTQYLA